MADYAKQQQQKIKEATERLEAGIKDFFTNGSYQEYLKVMSRFHNYSYSNSVMIALQKPDATLLAGYSGWQKNFERHVLPGEHGIRIFAPAPVKTKIEQEKKDPETKLPVLDENGDPVMETVEIKTPRFKVVTVFDVSQTDGKPLPELDINELNGSVQDFQKMFEAIVRSSDVPVELEDIEGEAKGYFSTLENKIVIQKDMSEAQTIKTALHELAHSRLHKINTTLPPGKQPVTKDRNTKEVEAESVAYVVCQHFNIDTSDYSFGYVATWSENRELPELKSSLDTIRKASAGIINDLESHLAEIEITRDIEIDHAELPTEGPEKPIFSEEQIKSLTFDRYKKQLEENSIPQIDSYLADFDQLYVEGQLDNLKPDPSTFIQDTPEHLASAINTFIESYDPYMSKESPDIITENIKTGNIGYLQEWLKSISSEEPDFHQQAQQLLKRISSLSPNTETIPEIRSIDIHQLAVDIDRYCHDYDTYEYRDAIDDSDTFIPKLEHDLSSPHRINSVKAYLQEMIDESNDPESIKDAFKLLDRMAKLPADPTITFYTAECMEFPTLGELHEHLTLKKALTYYELIPGTV